MCGIVGYIGTQPAIDFLLQGLQRLEYRGYDSAGVATTKNKMDDSATGEHEKEPIALCKTVGRIDNLQKIVTDAHALHGIGIGHTRWATHGTPVAENAHPHLSQDQKLALVHNGVVENYQVLKKFLQSKGVHFQSDTDSEVIVQLIAYYVKAEEAKGFKVDSQEPSLKKKYAPLVTAVQLAVARLQGTYGLVVMFQEYPDLLIAVRQGSPLVIGIGNNGHYVASDGATLAGYTKQIVYMADHQLALLTKEELQIHHPHDGEVKHLIEPLEIETREVDLGNFEHYMLKEIHEQPQAVRNTLRGRLNDENATAVFGGLNLSPRELRNIHRIVLTACGTSWHAALVGEYLIEEFARIPVEVEYASELRYRNPPVEPGTLLFAITQSGETADTLAALREMKRKGHPSLAICNVVGSTIAQESDGGIYLHAGPEVGVASTKAFTSQCVTLACLALYLGRIRHLNYEAGGRIIQQLRQLPAQIEQVLQTNGKVQELAEKYHKADNFLYLGRQYNFPAALEGALKLKEISYIHAEGYPAAEMKHGPIALVDAHTPSIFIMPQGFVYEKVMSNLEEIKARGGPVIAIAEEGDDRIGKIADDVIYTPQVEEFLQPVISSIPLQLLAYHIALLRGCDVDRPRNLAKSVTVE
ncbi:MAG: glutamine--fructose-6-phosphate transaminase (isomerizing) [Pirellulaceae bacterium]|nr:glutamine--fructose-6-phosphate transaminase (isomerizing) [Pirellulaceae bacterium]